ncbi:TonB-dependent copper receptor [Iodobacter sp. LRB]|uniref:TonB-dependent copper receptor n=1 Tax=unclassified Iodobacter TaxID=235634 RepID=UPI000C1054B1|nr:TonB-dependent copper receptor [Iodobacter sp. BJB302]PHV00278.1 TonB-dependent copper receptor [Iodobacter sp. BJB302]
MKKIIVLALSTAFSTPFSNAETIQLSPVIVTAPAMQEALKVEFDARNPQQPLPATDGASFLKTIPGMNVIRKGGIDGDPVFRGMAGSRLNILLDGEQILGGCGGRMDPPTAYIFADSYDKVSLLKGPQTVLYGPGNSAGTVLFERKPGTFSQGGIKANAALTVGSFGRFDAMSELAAGNGKADVSVIATHSRQDDYKDGNGNAVHSNYQRHSANLTLGWTPDEDTRLQFSATQSDGEAAYADRGMDGSQFARNSLSFKFSKKNISPLLKQIDAQLSHAYIVHVMDNYSLRPYMPGKEMASNPDRLTWGGRMVATLNTSEESQLKTGLDFQQDEHSLRTGKDYQNKPRIDDARFKNSGVFAEFSYFISEQSRLISGARADFWQANDRRLSSASARQERNEVLGSGFVRLEQDISTDTMVYAGLGRSERAPDYWELISKQSADSNSAFHTATEKTSQLDLGAIHQSGPLSLSASAFYNLIDDYILIQSGVPNGSMGTKTISRNVGASTWGGEMGLAYQISPKLKSELALSYVRGNNHTDHSDLAQIPPLESRLNISWNEANWNVGGLIRAVSAQNRIDIGKGNIVGQDTGSTAGFTIFSLNAAYKPSKNSQLSIGVDNLFDRNYSEHISRAGAMVGGYLQTSKINEPGRTLWLKGQINL